MDSHLLPKAAYRIIGKNKKRKKSPVLIKAKEGRAVFSDAQIKKHLLCAECEQRFSDKENIIAKFWYRGNGFLLRNQLRQLKIFEVMDGQRIFLHYPPLKLSEDDCYYFFVSLLWRAACGPWPGYGGVDFISPEFVEKMRLYLLGVAEAPAEIKIIVWVDWLGVIEAVMTLPVKDKESNSALILLLGMLAEIHIDDGVPSSIAPLLRGFDNKVWLVLDKRRCGIVFNDLVRIAKEVNANQSG